MKLVLLFCPLCGGTGFRPVKRAYLYVGAGHRRQDLRRFILYELCRCWIKADEATPAA